MGFVSRKVEPAKATSTTKIRTFNLLLMGACGLAGATHFAFTLLFAYIGIQPMIEVNVASLLVYVVAAWAIHNDRLLPAVWMMLVELITHAVLAVVVVGWSSGFHYYLLITIPVALTSPYNGRGLKSAVCVLVGLCYLGLDWGWRLTMPWYAMAPNMLRFLHLFNLLTTMVILAALTTLYVRMITETERRLHAAATTDTLTGLLNRRCMQEALNQWQARSKRDGHTVTIVMVDIDHFKALNDGWGHAVGDVALQAVANTLKNGVREVDYVARWGGEEFLILLPGTNRAEAKIVTERLRRAIVNLQLNAPDDGTRLPLTVTLGLSELRQGEDPDQTIQRADAALYEGKSLGRNQVVAA